MLEDTTPQIDTQDTGLPGEGAGESPAIPPSEPAAPPTPGMAPPEPHAPGAQPSADAGDQPRRGPAPAAPAGGAQSFSFRADGEDYEIEGSVVHPDGRVTVPADQMELVVQLMAEGAAHRGSWRQREAQYEQEITALRSQLESIDQHPDIVRARLFNQKILELFDRGETAVAEWLDNFAQNRPLLEAQVERDLLQQRLAASESQSAEAREEREADQLAPQIEQSIAGVIEGLAGRPEFAGVDPEVVFERCTRRYLDSVAYEVPRRERSRGLEAGETLLGQSHDGSMLYIINEDTIAQEFADLARFGGKAAGTAVSAATRNAAAVAAGGPPPVPPGGGAGGEAGGPVPGLPKSREELDRWISSGDWRKNFPA